MARGLAVSEVILIECVTNSVYVCRDLSKVVVQADLGYALYIRILKFAPELSDHEIYFRVSFQVLIALQSSEVPVQLID
jgi:hypothetical protein